MPNRTRVLEGLARFFRLESWLRLLFLCVLVGIGAGLTAVLFDRALHYGLKCIYWALLDPAQPGRALDVLFLIGVPAVGLFWAGWFARAFAPEACGGGVDAVIRAFHRGQGQIRTRVAFLRGLCTLLTIGSGGSAGREGPMAQMGAAVGSAFSRLLRLSVRDRRLLMLAGCAGGLGAVLRAPLGAALFSAEMLYREPDFEHDAVIPGVISSVTAYSVFTAVLGFEPTLSFRIHGAPVTPRFPTAQGNMLGELLHYAVLSLFCAVAAFLLVKGLRLFRTHVFGRLPVRAALKPLLGGLALGILTLLAMLTLWLEPGQILAEGKPYVQDVIEHVLQPERGGQQALRFTLQALALALLAKIIATGLTVGSGASGGLLFPTLFTGALTGALYAELWLGVPLVPGWLSLNPEARAGMIMVAMGGVFAGCTKAPIASLVLVSEMTGSYGLAVPLMLCCASTYLLTTSFTLEEEQVRGMAESPAHRGDFLVNVLEDITVGAAIAGRPKPELVRADLPFNRVLERIKNSAETTFPIVDEHDCLIGVFSLGDIRQIMNEQSVGSLVVAGDLGSTNVATVTPETRLSDALTLFTQKNISVLPVVEAPRGGGETARVPSGGIRMPRGPVGSKRVVGVLSRQDLILAYRRHLLEVQAVQAQDSQGGRVFEEAQAATVEPEPAPPPPRQPQPLDEPHSSAHITDEGLLDEPTERPRRVDD